MASTDPRSSVVVLLILASILAATSSLPLPECVDTDDTRIVCGRQDLADQLVYRHKFVIDATEPKCIGHVTGTVDIPKDYGVTRVTLDFPDKNKNAVESRVLEGPGSDKVVFNFVNRNNHKVDVLIEIFAKKC